MAGGAGVLAEVEEPTEGAERETAGKAIVWHKETYLKRQRLSIPDLAIKPWTGRAPTHLRGLPRQLEPYWCFQNEFLLSKHLLCFG